MFKSRKYIYRTAQNGAKINRYGICLTKDEYNTLTDYASERKIRLQKFNNYIGSIESIKTVIDSIVLVAEDFPLIIDNGRHSVILRLTYDTHEERRLFATTVQHVIELNGIYYSNIFLFDKEYSEAVREGKFVKNTDYHAVIYHEIGHVVCNLYKLNSKKIAYDTLKWDYMRQQQLDAYLMEYLRDNLSIYSASPKEKTWAGFTNKIFEGDEIISEVFSAYYSGAQNEFASQYMKQVFKIVFH